VVQHPDLVPLFTEKVELFVSDSFHPSLRVLSLSGVLHGLWAMRINYDQRLIFKFMDEAHTIVLLIDIGTHDKVY
jgi:mRNA-degrading endonuclease YafQ of YafQ-DinJ toxin-antitoxin module